MDVLEQFQKQPKAAKIGLFAFLAAAILGAEYQMFYVPRQEQIKKLDAARSKLRVDLAESQAIADSLPKFREKVAILNEELKRAVELLPDRADVQGLYRSLANEAKKANVDLVKFRPTGTTNFGFYSGLGMNIEIRGTYHDMAIFIDHVGKLNRIVNISNLAFSSPKKSKDKIELTITAKATTFMFGGK